MTQIRSNRENLRCALIALLLFGSGIGIVSAGPADDYSEGMKSRQEGDFVTAVAAFRKAADAGHPEAQAILGSILDAAEQDEEAVAYYQMSAATGNLNGIVGLAGMLLTGDGVKKDFQQARKLFTRAAEAGHKVAILAVAGMFIDPSSDIPDSERKGPEALKWITMAADSGHFVALVALEKAYRTGDYGLTVDLVKARTLDQQIQKLRGITGKKRSRGAKKDEN
jgi:TPR repeat protein